MEHRSPKIALPQCCSRVTTSIELYPSPVRLARDIVDFIIFERVRDGASYRDCRKVLDSGMFGTARSYVRFEQNANFAFLANKELASRREPFIAARSRPARIFVGHVAANADYICGHRARGQRLPTQIRRWNP